MVPGGVKLIETESRTWAAWGAAAVGELVLNGDGVSVLPVKGVLEMGGMTACIPSTLRNCTLKSG